MDISDCVLGRCNGVEWGRGILPSSPPSELENRSSPLPLTTNGFNHNLPPRALLVDPRAVDHPPSQHWDKNHAMAVCASRKLQTWYARDTEKLWVPGYFVTGWTFCRRFMAIKGWSTLA